MGTDTSKLGPARIFKTGKPYHFSGADVNSTLRRECPPFLPCRGALLAFCKERLADFKRPKQIHIIQAIPRTATGKIQRGAVAKAYTPA